MTSKTKTCQHSLSRKANVFNGVQAEPPIPFVVRVGVPQSSIAWIQIRAQRRRLSSVSLMLTIGIELREIVSFQPESIVNRLHGRGWSMFSPQSNPLARLVYEFNSCIPCSWVRPGPLRKLVGPSRGWSNFVLCDHSQVIEIMATKPVTASKCAYPPSEMAILPSDQQLVTESLHLPGQSSL